MYLNEHTKRYLEDKIVNSSANEINEIYNSFDGENDIDNFHKTEMEYFNDENDKYKIEISEVKNTLNEIINNQKLIYSIYAFIKSVYGNKRGRKYKVSLIYQIVITIFKLRYNLPDRVLEGLLKIDHVTISRIIQRISLYIGNIKLPRDNKNELNIIQLFALTN